MVIGTPVAGPENVYVRLLHGHQLELRPQVATYLWVLVDWTRAA
jgi:hypothetical protein